MSKPITLELTPQEAQALVDVLEIATNAGGGLKVARVTVSLTDKLMQAVEASRELPVDNAG